MLNLWTHSRVPSILMMKPMGRRFDEGLKIKLYSVSLIYLNIKVYTYLPL